MPDAHAYRDRLIAAQKGAEPPGAEMNTVHAHRGRGGVGRTLECLSVTVATARKAKGTYAIATPNAAAADRIFGMLRERVDRCVATRLGDLRRVTLDNGSVIEVVDIAAPPRRHHVG